MVAMFWNRMPSNKFGPKTEKVRGDCPKLNNEELHDLFSSNTIWIKKNELDRACNMYGLRRRWMQRNHLEDLYVYEMIRLKWTIKKWDG
jgi:hypothetical protein